MAQQQTTDVVVARGDVFHSHPAGRHKTATRKSNIIHIYTKRVADTSVTPTNAKKKMTRHRENENRERNQKSKSSSKNIRQRETRRERTENQQRAKEEEGKPSTKQAVSEHNKHRKHTTPQAKKSPTNEDRYFSQNKTTH